MYELYLFIILLIPPLVLICSLIVKNLAFKYINHFTIKEIGSIPCIFLFSPFQKMALISLEFQSFNWKDRKYLSAISKFLMKICKNSAWCIFWFRKTSSSIKSYMIIFLRSLLKAKLIKLTINLISEIISETAKEGIIVNFSDKNVLRKLLEELYFPHHIISVNMNKMRRNKSGEIKEALLEIPEKIFYEFPCDYSLYIGFKYDGETISISNMLFLIKSIKSINLVKLKIDLSAIAKTILSVIIPSEFVYSLTFTISFDKLLKLILRARRIIVINSARLEHYFSKLGRLLLISISDQSISYPQLGITEDYTKGDVFIGWQLKNGIKIAPFYIKINDFTKHMVIVGTTGSGKSSLAKIIIDELVNFPDIKIWIFDFHGEYYNLNSVECFNVIAPSFNSSIAINMFECPSDKEDYASFLSKLLIELIKTANYEISPQVERIISLAVKDTIFSNERNPLMFLWYLWKYANIMGMPSPHHAFNAIVNRIRPIFSGISAKVFWVKKSNVCFHDLINRNILYDLSVLIRVGVYKHNVYLFTNLMLKYAFSILSSQIAKSKEWFDKEKPRLLVFIEEAQYVVPWRAHKSSIEASPVEDLILLARKYGLGVIIIAPSIYVISQDVVRNSKTIVMFNGDYQESGILPNLDLVRYALVMPSQEALIKLSGEGIFHVKIRDYKNYYKRRSLSLVKGSTNTAYEIPITFDDAVYLIMKGKLTPDIIKAVLEGNIDIESLNEVKSAKSRNINYSEESFKFL